MNSKQSTSCVFHHVHIYTKKLQTLEYYKDLEAKLNGLANRGRFDPFSGGMRFLEPKGALPERILQGQELWKSLITDDRSTQVRHTPPDEYSPCDQDLVEQLLVGLGWRVTAQHVGTRTRSVLVTSMDALGVKMIVSAIDENIEKNDDNRDEYEAEYYDHFDAKHMNRFYDSHSGREGVAVLGFELGSQGLSGKEPEIKLKFGSEIERVFEQYRRLHPRMLVHGKIIEYSDVRARNKCLDGEHGTTLMRELGKMKVFEAYAYYKDGEDGEVDTGTVIRFVERKGSYAAEQGFGNPQGVLPGLRSVQYTFAGTSIPAYSDHWVSNVVNRVSFLKTLNDVLGFTPKVDFNAGVVAAGRAKIESTVTGNDAPLFAEFAESSSSEGTSITPAEAMLKNQTQVYLPINNSLSDIGHVHGFLKEIGQGIQHLANRVENLVAFIERANNYRQITGKGFSFLRIPRSYYGHLDVARDITSILNQVDPSKGKAVAKGKSENEVIAEAIFDTLVKSGTVTVTGIVDLNVSNEEVSKYISDHVDDVDIINSIAEAVLRARYYNLHSLLRGHLCERTYLQIVRNQVLVDIQGHDILYQIFTSNILQRGAGDEAPFLEFIQRVCSEKRDADGKLLPIKPGCGGFGIRNFLTLFLSIEVSKAMDELEIAVDKNDNVAAEFSKARIDLFTKQLNESNPVLTQISDAMTNEAEALESLAKLENNNDTERKKLEVIAKEMNEAKIAGNGTLQEISSNYVAMFKKLEMEYKLAVETEAKQ